MQAQWVIASRNSETRLVCGLPKNSWRAPIEGSWKHGNNKSWITPRTSWTKFWFIEQTLQQWKLTFPKFMARNQLFQRWQQQHRNLWRNTTFYNFPSCCLRRRSSPQIIFLGCWTKKIIFFCKNYLRTYASIFRHFWPWTLLQHVFQWKWKDFVLGRLIH